MLIPALLALLYRPNAFHIGIEYRYAMGMGAPLMFGWSVLLLWADRKPVERKGILPITLLVILGEIITQIWGIAVGFIPLGEMVPTFIIQSALSVLFCIAYFRAAKVQ